MKTSLFCIVALWSAYVTAATNVVENVNDIRLTLRSDYGQGRRFPSSIQIREDWKGTGISANRHFNSLQNFASNHWQNVLLNLNCLTNQDDRLIVIAACAVNNEEDYLARIDCLADMVLSNRATTVELTYFVNRSADVSHSATSALVRRYDEPSISNLIMKVNAAGGISGGVADIFSGEEKRGYEDAVREGLIP